jgi:hypothetical protein
MVGRGKRWKRTQFLQNNTRTCTATDDWKSASDMELAVSAEDFLYLQMPSLNIENT